MSNPFEHQRPTELEDKAHAEVIRHFAGHFKQFPASRETIDRLERDIAKISLAANMAASKPKLKENFVQADDGAQWHRDVELAENIFLCHRPVISSAEYATVEHSPKTGVGEVLNRGWNAAEVVKEFTQQQRQTLQLWAEDVRAEVGEFLAERFPTHDLSRVADSLMHRLATQTPSHRHTQSHGENHNRGMRV